MWKRLNSNQICDNFSYKELFYREVLLYIYIYIYIYIYVNYIILFESFVVYKQRFCEAKIHLPYLGNVINTYSLPMLAVV